MSSRPRNAFLRSLTAEAFELLAQHLVPLEMQHGQVLAQPDQPVDWVYFPENCLLSIITNAVNGDGVETVMVGSEGALGLLEACGTGRNTATNIVQVEGHATRAPAKVCKSLTRTNDDFADSTFSLFEMQAFETRQSGMCNALHAVEPRMARWLLESSERAAGRNPLPLTQEFLAAMLGVQRTTVTSFAGQMEKAGLTKNGRGRITLLDAEGLEHRSCECRKAMVEQRQRHGLEPLADAKAHLSVVRNAT